MDVCGRHMWVYCVYLFIVLSRAKNKNHRFNCRNWKTHANFCRSLLYSMWKHRWSILRLTIRPAISHAAIENIFQRFDSKFQVHRLCVFSLMISFLQIRDVQVCGCGCGYDKPIKRCDEFRSNSFDTKYIIIHQLITSRVVL